MKSNTVRAKVNILSFGRAVIAKAGSTGRKLRAGGFGSYVRVRWDNGQTTLASVWDLETVKS